MTSPRFPLVLTLAVAGCGGVVASNDGSRDAGTQDVGVAPETGGGPGDGPNRPDTSVVVPEAGDAPCVAPSGRVALAKLSWKREITQLVVDASALYGLDEHVLVRIPLPCGAPVVLATGKNNLALALDGAHVYWGSLDGFFGVPTGGGAVTIVATSTIAYPLRLAAQGGALFWADGSGTVSTLPVGGGTPKVLASGYGSPGGIAVDATTVYWTESVAKGRVLAVPLAGGTVRTLASDQVNPIGVVVDGGTVYWTEGGTSGTDFPYADGAVHEVSIATGAASVLARHEAGPDWIGVLGDTVYWVDNGGPDANSALRKKTGSAAAVDLAAVGFGGVDAFALDAHRVYWAQYTSNDVVWAQPN